MGQDYLKPGQIAAELNVTDATVRNWCRDGKLKADQPGGKLWRIKRADLIEFLKKRGEEEKESDSLAGISESLLAAV